jgi:hypothetical protein
MIVILYNLKEYEQDILIIVIFNYIFGFDSMVSF